MAQPNSKATDRATLRARFIAAFSRDFDLIDDQLKTRTVERGGGTFWLAFVQPKHTGYFSLQYRHHAGSSLEIREHELNFTVGPQGCRRGVPDSRSYVRFCLEDTIILPVLVNNYSGHEFKLAKAERSDEKEASVNSNMDSHELDMSAVTNPAAPILHYIGRSSHRLYHIIPGYTLSLIAEFQAQEPGRMNLFMTAEGQSATRPRDFDGVPIIVLPRAAPATLIAGREEVRGYRKDRDGHESVAWSTRNLYMTSVLILQPGDRINLGYYSMVRNSDYVAGRFGDANPDPNQNLKPVISVRPFAANTEYEFTEWIVDYLAPRSKP